MQNPFSTTFNRVPDKTYIRTSEVNEIVQNFQFDRPSEAVYKITGVRGSGKTVLLSMIQKEMSSENYKALGWIVYSISPARNMLQQLAACLVKEPFIKDDSKNTNINVSASVLGSGGGVGVAKNHSDKYFDIGVSVETFLKEAQKHDKKILLCVDEVSKNEYMKEFALEFGKWMVEDLPIYFVCTGLYENVQELGNIKNLTFFRRGKTIETKPLSEIAMQEMYKSKLGVVKDTAKEMALYTNGYAYAYQLLGSLYFDKRAEKLDDILDEYKMQLFANSYEKIWEELSYEDKELVKIIVKNKAFSRNEILEKMGNKANNYSVYRDRLLKKGIIKTEKYGTIKINPPFFSEYVLEYGDAD